MEASTPRISVVVPAYNAAGYLGRALASIDAQTYPVTEIVVVDDGSTDETAELVRSHFPHVRYIQQNNAGVAAARNHGIQVAHGDWIAFLDADDDWLPNRIADQCEILQRHPDLPWCSCRVIRLQGDRATPNAIPARLLKAVQARGYFDSFFRACAEGVEFHTCSMLIRRDILDHAGGFDTDLQVAEDRDLLFRIGLEHAAIGYAVRPGLRYHVDTPGSLTKVSNNLRANLGVLAALAAQARKGVVPDRKGLEAYVRRLAFKQYLKCAADPRLLPEAELDQFRKLLPVGGMRQVLLSLLELMPARVARLLINRLAAA